MEEKEKKQKIYVSNLENDYLDLFDELSKTYTDKLQENSFILQDAKKYMSDAFKAIYDDKMPAKTYKVLDINNNIIAYAWFEKNGEFSIYPNYNADVLPKRVN